MTNPSMETGADQRRLVRSIAAILIGIVVGALLSLAVDQLLHVLKVYPPWGAPMYDPGLNLLALSYRIVFTIFACYLIARLAPHSPMRHALIGGAIGFVLSLIGAIVAIPMKVGPTWYPVLLALTAIPCAWLGGTLYVRRSR